MRTRGRFKKDQQIGIAELYKFNPGTLWAAFKQQPVSLWMLCIYFFFEYVRPQNIYPVLAFLPWGQISLLAAIITAFTDPRARWVRNVQSRWLIAFSLVIIISGMAAFRPLISLGYWEVMLGWVIIYFVGTSVVNDEKRLLLFLLAYTVINLKMSVFGTISWGMRGFTFRDFGLIGSPGWFKNSGEYAIQMLIFGSLAISLVYSFQRYWSRRKKWFINFLAVTGYLVVLGASSRGSQLALVMIAVWLLLKQKDGLKGLLVIVILSVLLFYFLPDQQLERFRQMGDDSDSLQRLAYWTYGLNEVIPNHLFLGIGYHNWLTYLNYMVPSGMGPYSINQESHNIYIQATSELGLAGLFCFLMLVYYAFKNNRSTRRMAKKIDKLWLFNLSYGLDAGLIGYLIAGSFVTVLYYPYFWIQIMMIVMLNNVTGKLHTQLTEKKPASRFRQ